VSSPAGLVLAAGGGSRFGGPKALARWGDQLFVDRAVETLRAAGCAPIVVVLGASASDIAKVADLGDAVVIVNDAWPTGMGSSLCTGLAVLADLSAPAAVVMLVDQPQVSPVLVRRLVSSWSEGVAAVSASYDGRRRNPVILDASVWPAVVADAVGDVGARGWLDAHPDDVVLIACDDLGSDIDVDTPLDLHLLTSDPAKDRA
jgi:CTP:molybdopterin cytidylyltransferase MocA